VSGPLTNDVVHPKPRTDLPPGRTLTFDFPGLEIGVAEYEEGPTGCTVFHFPEVASLAIDVRGGSPGINGQHLDVINAICFAGGSLYGLEASTGVAAELFAVGDYSTKWTDIALVSGAIILTTVRGRTRSTPTKISVAPRCARSGRDGFLSDRAGPAAPRPRAMVRAPRSRDRAARTANRERRRCSRSSW